MAATAAAADSVATGHSERREYKSLIPANGDIYGDAFDPGEFMARTRERGSTLCSGAAVKLSVSRLSLVAGGAHNMYTVVLQTGECELSSAWPPLRGRDRASGAVPAHVAVP